MKKRSTPGYINCHSPTKVNDDNSRNYYLDHSAKFGTQSQQQFTNVYSDKFIDVNARVPKTAVRPVSAYPSYGKASEITIAP